MIFALKAERPEKYRERHETRADREQTPITFTLQLGRPAPTSMGPLGLPSGNGRGPKKSARWRRCVSESLPIGEVGHDAERDASGRVTLDQPCRALVDSSDLAQQTPLGSPWNERQLDAEEIARVQRAQRRRRSKGLMELVG